MKRIRKCAHCSSIIEKESVTLEYRLEKETYDYVRKKVYCSANCMVEALYDERIRDEIDREVRKELNWLHKQICTACRRRIM